MEEKDFLLTLSDTKADITPYPALALKDSKFRDILVRQLLNNHAINVYHHSFLILHEAIKTEPSLFYCYWDGFSSLLKHGNSYHRNYGMALIANLIAVDKDNRFELIMDDYFKQLEDEKISTIKYCISNSLIIIKAKPVFGKTIISRIIHSLRFNDHSDRHQKFLVSVFLKLLASIDKDFQEMAIVKEFIRDINIDKRFKH